MFSKHVPYIKREVIERKKNKYLIYHFFKKFINYSKDVVKNKTNTTCNHIVGANTVFVLY